MAEQVNLNVAGLQVSNSTASASPPGSQSIATNIVIDQKGVAQPRNGQSYWATSSGFTKNPYSITDFRGTIIHNDAVTRTSEYDLSYVSAGASFQYTGPFSGVFNPVDYNDPTLATGMKWCQAGRVLNFCTNNGPLVLEDPTADPRRSGFAQVPDSITRVLSASEGTGWMPYNSSVGYSIVYKYTDMFNVPHKSVPSATSIVTNRILAQIGQVSRTNADDTVTVTLLASFKAGLDVGDTFTLEPGEANFPAGTYTVVSTTGDNVFTYEDGLTTADAQVNTVVEDFDTGPRPVLIQWPAPDYAAIGGVYQIYRSEPITPSTSVPDPDQYLVAEVAITTVTTPIVYFDTVPDGIPNVPLYTNPADGEGAGQSNFPPPIYRDITNFQGQTYFSNTQDEWALNMEMLGVGPDTGVQDGDTLTISDGVQTVNFVFTDTPSAGEVTIVSDGLPDYNILHTTINLITTINDSVLVGIDCFSNSAIDGVPGKFIVRRNDWGPQFNVTVSRPESWTPGFKSDSTPVLSSNNRQPNGLYFSKLNQPEAVPVVNFMTVGQPNYFIQRIFGLRNSLIICKSGDGIWSWNGSSLQQVSNANIIAPNSACICYNKVWVDTDQGYMEVADISGCDPISRPVETVINAARQEYLSETFIQGFAVPYETERRIMFYTPVPNDTNTGSVLKAFVYSYATEAWTTSTAPALCGVVGIDNLLYLGAPGISEGLIAHITQERKSYTYNDIADGNFSANILAVIRNPQGGPDIIELDTKIPQRGDGITQGIWRTKIVAHRTDLGDFHYEVLEQIPWLTSGCSIYQAFPVEIQFLPMGNLMSAKVLTSISSSYKPESFANAFGVTTVWTDQAQWELEIPTSSYGFGFTPFGEGTFGNPCPMTINVSQIANSHSVASQFYVGMKFNEVWMKFKCQGFGLELSNQQAPIGRGGLSHV